MQFFRLRAFLMLIYIDFYIARRDFGALYRKLRTWPLGQTAEFPDKVATICAAIDLASIWYWKQVLCLQRSAATVCLLKDCGIRAQLVIGAQQMPFRAH